MGIMDWLDDVLGLSKGAAETANYWGLGTPAKVAPKPPSIQNPAIGSATSAFEAGLDALQRYQQKLTPTSDDIFARLQQLQDPSRYMPDQASLLAQSRAAADAQYGPLIAELQNRMGSAQTRADRGTQQVGNMYGALSQSYTDDIPGIEEKFAKTKQTSADQFSQLQESIGQTYDSTQNDQEEMYKRLGIEAAAEGVIPQQQRDEAYFKNVAAQNSQTEQSALGTEERGNTEFTRRGSEIARYEGTGRQSDIQADLADLLQQLEGQVGTYNAARESATQAGVGQLSSQASQNAQARAQQDFQNYIAQIQLGRDLKKDAQSSAGTVSKVSSLADVAPRTLSMGLGQDSAQKIQSTFMNAVGTDPNILAGIDSKFGNALPKEALAQRIVEAGRQQGLSQQELNALQVMALEYFGRA